MTSALRFVFPRWWMNVALRNQKDYAKEEEAFRGPIAWVWSVVIPKTSLGKNILRTVQLLSDRLFQSLLFGLCFQHRREEGVSKISDLMTERVKVEFASAFRASVRVLVRVRVMGGQINTLLVKLPSHWTNTMPLFWATGRMMLFVHLTCISWSGLDKIWDIVPVVSRFSKAHQKTSRGRSGQIATKRATEASDLLSSRKKAILGKKQAKRD